ncbi:MAG: (d)CMP kinase [Bacteroidales bacterium]|nr:(d)CMP kinase [Bacteroidales bacterium]
MPDIIIAIDGYSSTGKSSFAKLIASEFSFLYLDSGAMYRAVTLAALEQGVITQDQSIDEPRLKTVLEKLDAHFEYTVLGSQTFMGDRCVEQEIRSMKVSSWVSPVSALPFVRNWVDERLHQFAANGRVVMDGRDIGTTVFPNAELKLFMTASDRVRAQRRYQELSAKGSTATLEEVLENLKERDYMDSHREASPLQRAADAIVLDNSDMTMREELAWVKGVIQGKFGILE